MSASRPPLVRSERDLQKIVDAILDIHERVAVLEAAALSESDRVVGEVMDYAGPTPPSGWLVCDGSAVSRTTYAALFAAIGTAWGAGDGSTTFNLPDMRGRVGAGRDDMGGTPAGRLTVAGSLLEGITLGNVGGDEHLQEHVHVIT